MSRYEIADSSLYNLPYSAKQNYRGINVFTLSELRGITGQTKSGKYVTASVQHPIFTLSPEERIAIMQSSSYVQAVVGSRMNRISSLEWEIELKKIYEDEIYDNLKEMKQIYNEFNDPYNLRDMIVRYQMVNKIKEEIPEIKEDLSNFESAFVRYRRRINRKTSQSKEEIKEWIQNPNMEDDFHDFRKKWVESLMVHGAASIYKDFGVKNIDNFYVLPGGTMYPLRTPEVGGYSGYAQIITGHVPKIYFQDEITFTNYLPSAARSYGYVPLDALINKIAEQLMFDQYAAERADGTKEPEHMIIFGDNRSPFGDLTGDIDIPMNPEEQSRIEEKLNMRRKGAVATLSGVGHPLAVDISKANTFGEQSIRQDKLLRDIALVFNMTNMEINLAGGEFTSGKETSETQSEIEEGKGTRPIIQKIQSIINKQLIPYRFGEMFKFTFQKALSPKEQVELDALKIGSGTYTKNEVRTGRGDDPIIEEGNDSLQQQSVQQPDGSPFAPINTRQI